MKKLTIGCLVLMSAAAVADDEYILGDIVGKVNQAPKKEVGWNGDVSLGANLKRGNVDSFAGDFAAHAKRRWIQQSWDINGYVEYGKTDGEKSADSQKIDSTYRYDFSPRFFGFINGALSRDKVQLIKRNLLVTLGPGWRVWQNQQGRNYFDLEAGLGYEHKAFFRSPEDCDDAKACTRGERSPTRNDFVGRAAFESKYHLWAVETTWNSEYIQPFTDANAFSANSTLQLASPIAKNLFFTNAFRIDYENDPAEDSKKTDLTFTTGIKYQFN